MPPRSFARIATQLETVENILLERFKLVTRAYGNEYLGSVIVSPMLEAVLPPSASAPAADPSFWRPGYFRLFISHVCACKTQASALADALNTFAVSGFVAHEDIEPTKEWEGEIRLALNTMDALAALLTPGFKESNWTDQEVGIGLGRGVLVIPIRVGRDPYGFIGRYQAFQAAGRRPPDLAAEVASILSSHQLTREKMAYGLVSTLVESTTFAEALLRVQHLDLLKHCPEALAARLRQAVSENTQIRDAYGVPQRIAQFLKRHTGAAVAG